MFVSVPIMLCELSGILIAVLVCLMGAFAQTKLHGFSTAYKVVFWLLLAVTVLAASLAGTSPLQEVFACYNSPPQDTGIAFGSLNERLWSIQYLVWKEQLKDLIHNPDGWVFALPLLLAFVSIGLSVRVLTSSHVSVCSVDWRSCAVAALYTSFITVVVLASSNILHVFPVDEAADGLNDADLVQVLTMWLGVGTYTAVHFWHYRRALRLKASAA